MRRAYGASTRGERMAALRTMGLMAKLKTMRCCGLWLGIVILASSCALRLDNYFAKNDQGIPIAGNDAQSDAVKLPEAWYFMQDKWVSERAQCGRRWPMVVVIDDGFLDVDEFARPLIFGPAYGDRGADKGVLIGTSLADGNHRDVNCRGYHGTAVAMLLGGISNNLGNRSTRERFRPPILPARPAPGGRIRRIRGTLA